MVMVVIVVIVLGIILAAIIALDIYAAYVYHNASRTEGIVLQCEGNITVKGYGKFRYKKYGKYLIGYRTADGEFKASIPIRDSSLKVGDHVEVRYVKNSMGTHLLDDIASTRIREFAICVVLGGLLSIAIIYAKKVGILR
ncbi:MAG: hypothetical protein IKM28_05655 [Lachnospiraceae bacterium]|nr:hypothetical protein [Lachnospiraceae bacterium]